MLNEYEILKEQILFAKSGEVGMLSNLIINLEIKCNENYYDLHKLLDNL